MAPTRSSPWSRATSPPAPRSTLTAKPGSEKLTSSRDRVRRTVARHLRRTSCHYPIAVVEGGGFPVSINVRGDPLAAAISRSSKARDRGPARLRPPDARRGVPGRLSAPLGRRAKSDGAGVCLALFAEPGEQAEDSQGLPQGHAAVGFCRGAACPTGRSSSNASSTPTTSESDRLPRVVSRGRDVLVETREELGDCLRDYLAGTRLARARPVRPADRAPFICRSSRWRSRMTRRSGLFVDWLPFETSTRRR